MENIAKIKSTKRKVLLVDDMSTMRSVMRNGLIKTFQNIFIDEAVNGLEAQKKLTINANGDAYDLIISDIEMPGMNGLELLKWVRTFPNTQNTPFVMVTANNTKECVQQSIHLGVNAFLLKPFTVETLTNKISSLIFKFDRREHERFNAKDHPIKIFHPLIEVVQGSLIDISKGGCFGNFPRIKNYPPIFEDVRVEINYSDGTSPQKAVLSGFIIRLQSGTAFKDSDSIKTAIRFNDDDVQNKSEEIDNFFNHIRDDGSMGIEEKY